MSSKTTYSVEMDDGSDFEVTADQRDWAAMEAKEFPPAATATRVRFMVWSAARRAGQIKDGWERFNSTTCVSVEAQEDESEDEEGLDPGRRGASAATS
jgi:hypothetical protein